MSPDTSLKFAGLSTLEIDIESLHQIQISKSVQDALKAKSQSQAAQAEESAFTVFTQLPPELRAPVWKLALTPRIIKWTRANNQSKFTVPSKSFPLFDVCRESREIALLYGQYQNLGTLSDPVYFSPVVDYLLFDPGWLDLQISNFAPAQPDVDPLESLLPGLSKMRNVMVHPHYTDDRKRPTTLLEKLPMLERILVAADEKSIGLQSKFLLGSAYDMKLYYAATVKKRVPNAKVPYIAVGCLGWTGAERQNMRHGSDDTRKLVAVFDNNEQMKAHMSLLREEEWNFTQQFQRGGPKLTLNFRDPQREGLKGSDSNRRTSNVAIGLPSYSDQASSQSLKSPPTYAEAEGHRPRETSLLF